jgi:Cu(I)/Ag(I) efflux system periplasmic protein CusF
MAMNTARWIHRWLAAALLFSAALASAQSSDGEVRKLDSDQGKITLKHGEIKSLDMPAMTMVFRVKDKSWLSALAVGDKVKFDVEKIDGQYTVTLIKKMP